jgi:hypothetical protein
LVEIVSFIAAQYLYPIGMDEIEMSDYTLISLRDGFIDDLLITIISACLPGQTQFFPILLK